MTSVSFILKEIVDDVLSLNIFFPVPHLGEMRLLVTDGSTCPPKKDDANLTESDLNEHEIDKTG